MVVVPVQLLFVRNAEPAKHVREFALFVMVPPVVVTVIVPLEVALPIELQTPTHISQAAPAAVACPVPTGRSAPGFVSVVLTLGSFVVLGVGAIRRGVGF